MLSETFLWEFLKIFYGAFDIMDVLVVFKNYSPFPSGSSLYPSAAQELPLIWEPAASLLCYFSAVPLEDLSGPETLFCACVCVCGEFHRR